MEITLHLPDDIARCVQAHSEDVPRHALADLEQDRETSERLGL